jgi:hypothetical protein
MNESSAQLVCRPVSRRASHAARRALWLAFLLALPGGAQNPVLQPQDLSSVMIRGQAIHTGDEDGPMPRMEELNRLRLLNDARQKALVSDTNKLLKLTTELHAEIGDASPGMLTMAQLRKLSEIEKLAHSVKSKMSSPVQWSPTFKAPLEFPGIY